MSPTQQVVCALRIDDYRQTIAAQDAEIRERIAHEHALFESIETRQRQLDAALKQRDAAVRENEVIQEKAYDLGLAFSRITARITQERDEERKKADDLCHALIRAVTIANGGSLEPNDVPLCHKIEGLKRAAAGVPFFFKQRDEFPGDAL